MRKKRNHASIFYKNNIYGAIIDWHEFLLALAGKNHYNRLEVFGAIAQLVERLHGMQKVGGSIPLGSTRNITYLMYDHLYKLELSLLTPSVRKSTEILDLLLADEFIEFSSSGKVYNKKEILEILPLEKGFSTYSMENFNLVTLSPTVMLVKYTVIIDGVISLRSSIWKNNEDRWQMVFHQGTLVR